MSSPCVNREEKNIYKNKKILFPTPDTNILQKNLFKKKIIPKTTIFAYSLSSPRLQLFYIVPNYEQQNSFRKTTDICLYCTAGEYNKNKGKNLYRYIGQKKKLLQISKPITTSNYPATKNQMA